MKIALFSGQPDLLMSVLLLSKQCYPNYNVDVFGHLWFDEDLQTKPYKYGGNSDWEYQGLKVLPLMIFKQL